MPSKKTQSPKKEPKKQEQLKKYKAVNLTLSEEEHQSVKKLTVDLGVGFRDILLAGFKSLKGQSKCTNTSLKKRE